MTAKLNLLLFAISIYFTSSVYSEVQLGGSVTWVKISGYDSESGFGVRVMWFKSGGLAFGALGEFQRNNIGNQPQHSYTLFGGGAVFRAFLMPAFAPYAGSGLYVARDSISRTMVGMSTTFNNATIHTIVGFQVPFLSVSPFLEYKRVFYIAKDNGSPFKKANVLSFGVVFDITR